MSYLEEIYLVGVMVFTGIALKDRETFGRGLLYDLFSTIMVVLWPATLALLVVAMVTKKT